MTEWKAAMLLIAPLMALEKPTSRLLHLQKPRAWLAVFLSSVLAYRFPLSPYAYLAIDLFCGGLVIAKPAGWPQKAIGLIFTMMAVIDAGYIVSPRMDHGILYYEVMVALGWVQFAVLLAWGSYDAWGYCTRRFEPRRSVATAQADTR